VLMANVTELRRNIKSILEQVVAEKTPAVILQRSKPVAYLVDAESFKAMQEALVPYSVRESDAVIREMDMVRDRIAKRTGIQPDSTQLIRDLRSGKRNE